MTKVKKVKENELELFIITNNVNSGVELIKGRDRLIEILKPILDLHGRDYTRSIYTFPDLRPIKLEDVSVTISK